MSMNREQLIRICLNSGVVRRDVAINLIEIIENNTMEDVNKLVEAERKACAKVAAEWVRAYPHPSGIIENNILARGEEK